MQAEQAELHKLIDEADGAIIERLPKRQERKQHADRKSLPVRISRAPRKTMMT